MIIDLRILKQCLIVAVAVTTVVITFDQVYLLMRSRIVHEAAQKTELENLFSQKEKDLEPLRVFQEVMVRRNLFNVADVHTGGVEKKSSIAELVKDYRLKGIALFSTREGIIEDARTGGTVFVKEGEKLGPLTVKQIKEDGLIFDFEGEETEIRIQGGISS